ncbi:MAG TPA: TonB-dependent receptor [Kofleriaceae bacterium]|nr:TonB-dependent receptor [Kofleriaceae bacterium]
MVRAPFVLGLFAARVAFAQPAPSSDDEVIEVHGVAPAEPQPQQEQLSTEDMHDTPGGGNDALRGLQSLPGVARIPFGLGGLALRGAAPHDTRVFLDGIEVPILYHFGGLASFVPIEVLDHVELTPSGFGAEWGRGIGGVVVLDTRTVHPTRWTMQGEVSLLHAGALAIGPGPDGGSWTIGLRRSYVDAILAVVPVDLSLAPSYLDSQIRWESGDRHWMAIAFASDDDLTLEGSPGGSAGGISTSNVSAFDYVSRFARLGMRYRDHGVTITPWLGIDDYVAQATEKGVNKGFSRTDLTSGLRAEVETAVLGGTLRTGLDGRATSYAYTIVNTPPPTPIMPHPSGVLTRNGDQSAIDAGVFVEQEWRLLGGHLVVRPGVRADYFGLSDQSVIDPRLTVIERPSPDVAITESLGVYHEPPLVTDLDPVFGPRTLPPEQSQQASASAEAPIASGLFVGKVTGYVQAMDNLPVDVVTGATPIAANGGEQAGGLLAISRELVDEEFGSYSYREYVGHGRAWGVELLARREIGQITGWVSYTYARSFRTGDPRQDPTYYPYVLDQPHMLTAVATSPIGAKWRVGGRFRYVTGNPITPVATAYYNAAKKTWTAVDGPILSQRLPDFVQLDLRIDRLWRRRSGLWDLYLDVQNVTNTQNAEGVTYSADYKTQYYTHGLPIFPSLGIEYRPAP